MDLILKELSRAELTAATKIWNDVVAAADSFPGDEMLSEEEAWDMFAAQTKTICALRDGETVGVYILHPNNMGRCGHIANASYAVKRECRGQGIGRALVTDCLARAKECGFKGLQFNAVVCTNYSAIALYLKLGFTVLGTVKNGYRLGDGSYTDTLIFLKSW